METKFTAAALGCFDGVHIAHQSLIKKCAEYAKEHDLTPIAVTFDPLPERILGRSIKQLSTLAEKKTLLLEAGAKEVCVLDANRDLLDMTGEEFVRDVLVFAAHVRCVAVGYNYRFGRGGSCTAGDLRALGEKYGFDVIVMEQIELDGAIVSSSAVREALDRGDIDLSEKLLGRNIKNS